MLIRQKRRESNKRNAVIAQLVEHFLGKEEVTSSNLVNSSRNLHAVCMDCVLFWLCMWKLLQSELCSSVNRPTKKRLDKSVQIAYNRNRKSIPVDGLLPLLELRFNRRELVAGAVISFSCRGDSDYYFYDYSKCTRSRWSNPAESCRSSANHQRWHIDPSYRSPPICSNEQWEQKQTAYRFRYALEI